MQIIQHILIPELLRAQGIAPPVVRKERAVTPTDVVDLTMDLDEDTDESEIKKLEVALTCGAHFCYLIVTQMRLNALKNKNKRKQVKREPSDVKKEIKSEEPIFRPGEVIDLT